MTSNLTGPQRAPVLASSRVRLRPLGAADYSWLYNLALSEDNSYRWRARGGTPSPEHFAQLIWKDVLFQMVAEAKHDGSPLGVVQIINPDNRNQHAALSAIFSTDVLKRGWPLEAVVLAVNYGFLTWPFRKFYLESISEVVEDYRSALGRYLVEEGCLIDHEYVNGRWQNFHILALHRQSWVDNQTLVDAIIGTSSSESYVNGITP